MRRTAVCSSSSVEPCAVSLHPAHLRAVLPVGSERAVNHDHPVSVEAQLHSLFCNQLGPRGCQLHKTLSLAGKDIQFAYPLQHQVKVHAKVGSICGGELAGFSTENSCFYRNYRMQLTTLTASRVRSPAVPHPD